MAVAAACGAVGGPGWSERLGPLPWLLSLVVVGLPHGAADFAVSRRVCHGRSLAVVWGTYIAAMVAVGTGFVVAPLAAMVIFLAFSCWHFGRSHLDADRNAERRRRRIDAILGRGCAVVAAPLAAWPSHTAGVMAELAALATGRPVAADLVRPETVAAAGILLAAIAGASAAVEAGRSVRRIGGLAGCSRLAAELAAIVGLGVFTDPLFAVGTYFLVWHAWRQMADLDDDLSPSPAQTARELAGHLVHIHVSALPLLLPTWIMVGMVWWLWAPEPTLRALAIVSIGGYLVVTPAHELLGALLRTTASETPTAPGLDPSPPGNCRVRQGLRETSPSGGTSRNGLGRALPAAWG